VAGTKRAVVTGAASGIGRAVALRLLADGAAVVAVDLDEERLAPLRAAGAEILVSDLADRDDRWRVIEAGSGAHALVNAAGILRVRSIFECTPDDWRDIFAVNAEAIFFLCQGIGPAMPAGGAIVNLSSSSAKLATTTEVAIYAASKATILSVTRSFAHALADRGVRVNAICPGIVDTPMQETVLEEVAASRGTTRDELSAARDAAVPLGRSSSPEECAGLVAFLLSDEAAYMTGQAVNFTGGLVTW